jgi:hypothetical protein
MTCRRRLLARAMMAVTMARSLSFDVMSVMNERSIFSVSTGSA